jgi:small-conductance mechanosensitive channel
MHTIGVYLGAIEHRGVVDISGEKLVYQSRIKCSPGQQYTVTRALNAALKVILDKNNIVIPSQINLSTETMSMSNSEFKNMV